jgi:hypothetical protein
MQVEYSSQPGRSLTTREIVTSVAIIRGIVVPRKVVVTTIVERARVSHLLRPAS